MLVDGMTAANDLGLSDAVPGRIVIHTDARTRPIHIGKQTITFRPTAPSKLFWAGRPAMRVVQALHWLRGALSKPEDRPQIMGRLHSILTRAGEGAAIAADLRQGLTTLPAWMQDLVTQLVPDGDDQRDQPPLQEDTGEPRRRVTRHRARPKVDHHAGPR
jgi:hypothetical protein